MNKYIDVRGPWPVLTNGMACIVLEGEDRNITIEDAEEKIKLGLLWIDTIREVNNN